MIVDDYESIAKELDRILKEEADVDQKAKPTETVADECPDMAPWY